MKFPKRKHPRLKEYDYSNDGGYFVTVCVKNKEKLLGEPVLVNGKIKLTPIGETAEKHIKAINSAHAAADSVLHTFLTAVCGHTALRGEIYKFYECRRF